MHLLAALLVLPWVSLADLPVHCVRHQVVGDWEFTIGPASQKRSSCGHAKPDSPNAQPALNFLESHGPTTSLKLSLQDPSSVTTEDGARGSWTMIYDEAFEVSVNGLVFLAFSDFEFVQDSVKGRTNVSNCDRTQLGWYHDVGRTQWGCYVGRKAGLAAPAANAEAAAPSVAPQGADAGDGSHLALAVTTVNDYVQNLATDDSVATPVSDATSVAAPVSDTSSGVAPNSDTSPTADMSAVLAQPSEAPDGMLMPDSTVQAMQTIDSAVASDSAVDTTPAAAAADNTAAQLATDDQSMTLSPDAPETAAPQAPSISELETSSTLDTSAIDSYLAAPKSYKPFKPSAGYDRPMDTKWQESVADALNFLQLGWKATVYHAFKGKTVRELNRFAGVKHNRPVPEGGFRSSQATADNTFSSFLGVRTRTRRSSGHQSFDWRKKDGQDWLQPVVTQGDCGSCYTISTVHMLTARNRIAKNDPSKQPFSVMFPLYCSEYNQGCDGGYGFLQSKWAEDVGLVPESCAPFAESSSCHALSGCDLGSTRFRAANHHYVGGFYGASEEGLIREELVKNGPVVMSFEPKEDFMYYKSGVYKSGPNKIHQEWEQVDHAVLLVGYGEDKSQAYWTLQNSWGTDWGEAGFFRIARGIDESGCESIVVAADVVEEDSNEVLDNFLSSL